MFENHWSTLRVSSLVIMRFHIVLVRGRTKYYLLLWSRECNLELWVLSDNQCSSCKNTYGGMVGLQFFTQTLGGMVIIGLLVREWFSLKCFMGGWCCFWEGWHPSHPPLTRVLLQITDRPINLGSSLSKAKKYRNPTALKAEKVLTFGLDRWSFWLSKPKKYALAFKAKLLK